MAHSRAVEAFVEKPDAATAANYVAERYLWNSGNFLFHAATMLGEIERFEPKRRLPASRATSIFCGWQANPSHASPRNRLITPLCSVQGGPRQRSR